jgi:hypothetical protein
MNAYIYQAALFCEDCGRSIRKRLKQEGKAPDSPRDESTYDSDEYPKGPYQDGGGEADSPQHCGAGADCLNAMELEDGRKVGAWLENPLTSHGVEYVRQAIEDGGDVAEFWAEVYSEELA